MAKQLEMLVNRKETFSVDIAYVSNKSTTVEADSPEGFTVTMTVGYDLLDVDRKFITSKTKEHAVVSETKLTVEEITNWEKSCIAQDKLELSGWEGA